MAKRQVWDFIILIVGLFFLFLVFKKFSFKMIAQKFLIKVLILFAAVCALFLFFGLNAYDLHWVEQHYEGVGLVVLFIGLFEVFLLRTMKQRENKVL